MYDAISEFLQTHWDPIGVKDEPQAQGEYDGYVGGVYRLLASDASDRQIAQFLADNEAAMLGYEDTNPKMLIPVAQKLQRLYARLVAQEQEGG